MTSNNTCVPGNGTNPCPMDPSSPVGLAVGLTFFFLLLVIGAGVIVYKYHSKMRNMLQFEQRRSQKKKDFTETQQGDPHLYTSMIRDQPAGQTPIYENLTTRTNRPAVNKSR